MANGVDSSMPRYASAHCYSAGNYLSVSVPGFGHSRVSLSNAACDWIGYGLNPSLSQSPCQYERPLVLVNKNGILGKGDGSKDMFFFQGFIPAPHGSLRAGRSCLRAWLAVERTNPQGRRENAGVRLLS